MEITIREGTPVNGDEITKVYLASYNVQTAEDAKETYLRELKEDHHFFIAFDGDKAVGFISWYLHGMPHHGLVELNRIAVLKEYWRNGVGTQLFARLVKDARGFYESKGHQLRKLFLMTHDDNAQAQAFYEKMGMTKEAVLKGHYYDGRDEAVYSLFIKR